MVAKNCSLPWQKAKNHIKQIQVLQAPNFKRSIWNIFLKRNPHDEALCPMSYKVGPKTSYNWSYGALISTVIAPVTYLFAAIYKGYNSIYIHL